MIYRGVEPRPFESESNELADILIDHTWSTISTPKIVFCGRRDSNPRPLLDRDLNTAPFLEENILS
jgi:hypothetical protein